MYTILQQTTTHLQDIATSSYATVSDHPLLTLMKIITEKVGPAFDHLDPSNFQNIILGILAVFIPFAIVFLTNIIHTNRTRSEFEKLVLNQEVLGAKSVFWVSVVGLFILSFFSGTDVSLVWKIFSVTITCFLILVLSRSFKKTLRFSEGDNGEYEIKYLTGLNLSKVFIFQNIRKMELMEKSWSSLWGEKTPKHELEFSRIFSRHMDDLFHNKNHTLAVRLVQYYKNNISNRENFFLSTEILPNIFKWSDLSWAAEQEWISNRVANPRILKFFPEKHFPTFRKYILWIASKRNAMGNEFWDWSYFTRELFPAVSLPLLTDGHSSYHYFNCLKVYIDKSLEALNEAPQSDFNQRRWNYIVYTISNFTKVIFEDVSEKNSQSTYIWESGFPEGWKATTNNIHNKASRIILDQLVQWARKRILNKAQDGYDTKLSTVINGVFPNIDDSYFRAFFVFLATSDIRYSIENDWTFFVTGQSISYSGDVSETELQQMFQRQKESQRKETLNIILGYFTAWRPLLLFRENMTPEEIQNWGTFDKTTRESIIKRSKNIELQKIIDELGSADMLLLCADSTEKDNRRKIYIELFEDLLKQINADSA